MKEANKAKILVVEDSPTQASQLQDILEGAGFQVSQALNGNQALESINNDLPDMVISDILMPEMDGYRLCERLKADEKLKAVPVILLTALSAPENIVKGLECGADHFITKPYDNHLLISRIRSILINQELKKKREISASVEVVIAGNKYLIKSDRLQILDLLISTHETVLQQNRELLHAREEIAHMNKTLEERVVVRTADLINQINQRRGAEERIKRINCVLRALRNVNELIIREKDRENLIKKGCRLLVDTACYQLAWILLIDENNKFVSVAQAGVKDSIFSAVFAQFEGGDYLQCAREILSGGQPFTCCQDVKKQHFRCALAPEHPGGASFTARLEHEGKVYGVMSVDIPIGIVQDKEERGLFIGLAGDISFALAKMVEEKQHRQIDDKLIVTDRLASIGELASGIAHEINNPLTSIIGFSELMLAKELPPNIKEDLSFIRREARRTAEIVKNMLTFARKHPMVKQSVDINEVIKKVLELRAYEEKVSNIHVNAVLAADLPAVQADYFQLQQVFLNIIINAEYFMYETHGRGNLTITTERSADMVRASFANDGPGIPANNLDYVFDPFFTTKEVGRGTGLGLSICHGVITEHGGRIFAESEPGQGATFNVELPLCAKVSSK